MSIPSENAYYWKNHEAMIKAVHEGCLEMVKDIANLQVFPSEEYDSFIEESDENEKIIRFLKTEKKHMQILFLLYKSNLN
jgi:hypothetical protein